MQLKNVQLDFFLLKINYFNELHLNKYHFLSESYLKIQAKSPTATNNIA